MTSTITSFKYFGSVFNEPVEFSIQVLAYTGNDDGRKFVLDGEVTADRIKVLFCEFSVHLLTCQEVCMDAFINTSLGLIAIILTKFLISIFHRHLGKIFSMTN